MKSGKGVASHLPVLLEISKIFGKEIKNIVELGSGLVSSRLFLDKNYFPNVEKLISYEWLQEWFDKLNEHIDDERFDYRLYKDYEEIEAATGDLLFVDGNRKHRNKILRDFHNNFKLVVCHDIDLKWFNHISRDRFKFMWEYTPPGRQTGVMSNFIDVGSIEWNCKVDKKLEKLWLSVEETEVMNIDIGGQKAKRDMGGKWKICDIAKGSDYPCNLNIEPLPFKNNSIDAIFCSHLLEHLEPESLPKALQEMKRVLKPGAPMRICVPDAGMAVELYVKNPNMLKRPGMPSKLKSVPATKMGFLTCWFYTPGKGHRIGFDWELLHAYLTQAKFKKIARKKFNKGSEVFKGKDYTRYKTNSIFCEVVK